MNKLQTILNDVIGRRTEINRSGTKMTETRSDAYGYNDRSELTNAVKNATLNEYAYWYDDIGNRETSVERGTSATYAANCLNQYTDIEYSAVQPSTSNLQPLYDADGNQTLVKTKTGIWSVTYNGENRPIRWELVTANSNTSNSNTQTILEMKFDRMGRRVEYIESVGSVTNKHQKFVYDGYLCIQRLNGSNNSITELFEWDPTEPVATRPMFMQYRVPGQTYALFYTHDGNKNVSEVVHYSRANGVAAHYEYAPFGEVTAQVRQGGIVAYDFSTLNPWRFSSEYADDASATVYYNYRHYEPVMGRWMSRDTIEEKGGVCLYIFLDNQVSENSDFVGLIFDQCEIGERRVKEIRTKILPQTWDVNNDVENKISIVSTVATGLTLVSSFGSGQIQGGVWCGVGSAFGDGGKAFIEGNIVDLYVESIKKSSGRFSGWKIWTKAIWEKCECSSFMFIPRREFVEKEGKWEQCEYGGFRFGDSYIIQNPTSSRVKKCVTLRLKNELKKRE